jgi:hypothetical protein
MRECVVIPGRGFFVFCLSFSARRSLRLRVMSVRTPAASETVAGLVQRLKECFGQLLSQFQSMAI